jgi:hypothetical protein
MSRNLRRYDGLGFTSHGDGWYDNRVRYDPQATTYTRWVEEQGVAVGG